MNVAASRGLWKMLKVENAAPHFVSPLKVFMPDCFCA